MKHVRVTPSTAEVMDVWVTEILEGLQWQDPEDGRLAMKATLCALRDELSLDQLEEIARWLRREALELYFGEPRPRHAAEEAAIGIDWERRTS